MIDSKYRAKYQNWVLNPLLKNRWILLLSPGIITLFGLLTGLLSAWLIGTHHPYLGVSLLAFSGLCDTLDGSLARLKECMSDKGSVLDITSDRLVEFAIILGLYFVSPTERGLLSLLMLGSVLICITSFLVVAIFTQTQNYKSFFYSPGVMERSEAFILFALMIVFPFLYFYFAVSFSLLVGWTGIKRIYEFCYA